MTTTLSVLDKAARYSFTMGPWQFLHPDISNIVHLAGLYCGDDDALATLDKDKERRKEKAEAIKQLTSSWKEVEHKIAYLLKDAETIAMLKPVITKALAQVEDEVEFLAESNGP